MLTGPGPWAFLLRLAGVSGVDVIGRLRAGAGRRGRRRVGHHLTLGPPFHQRQHRAGRLRRGAGGIRRAHGAGASVRREVAFR